MDTAIFDSSITQSIVVLPARFRMEDFKGGDGRIQGIGCGGAEHLEAALSEFADVLQQAKKSSESTSE
jgi:hypothetical protein